jgi:ubiquinone biosynthesis protein UbiJ
VTPALKGLEKVWGELQEEAKGFITEMLPHIQAVGVDTAKRWVGHATGGKRGNLTATTLIYASLTPEQRKLWRDQSLESFTGEVDRFVAAARAMSARLDRLSAVAANAVFRVLPMLVLA